MSSGQNISPDRCSAITQNRIVAARHDSFGHAFDMLPGAHTLNRLERATLAVYFEGSLSANHPRGMSSYESTAARQLSSAVNYSNHYTISTSPACLQYLYLTGNRGSHHTRRHDCHQTEEGRADIKIQAPARAVNASPGVKNTHVRAGAHERACPGSSVPPFAIESG